MLKCEIRFLLTCSIKTIIVQWISNSNSFFSPEALMLIGLKDSKKQSALP